MLRLLERFFVVEIITAYFEAPTWIEAYHVIQRHPRVLLSETVDARINHMLREQITIYHKNDEFVRKFEKRWTVLRRCREIGVEKAFWEFGLDAPEIIVPPEFKAVWDNIGELEKRYQDTNAPHLLNVAIQIWENILDSPRFSTSHTSFQQAVLNDSGRAYFWRYLAIKQRTDLQKALDLWHQLSVQTPSDSPELYNYLINLGNGLKALYDDTTDRDKLNESIETYERAVKAARPRAPNLPLLLTNLGTALWERYQQKWKLIDLEKTLMIWERLVADTPSKSSEQMGYQNSLAVVLRERYHRLMNPSDLERAIDILEQIKVDCQEDLEDYPTIIGNLGLCLESLFDLTLKLEHLEHSITLYEEARRKSPPNSTNAVSWMICLSRGLRTRYERGAGESSDLDRAISTCKDGLIQIAGDSPYLANCWSELGNALRARFLRDGEILDLEQAINYHEQVVSVSMADSRHVADSLNNLAAAQRDYARHSMNTDYLDKSISAYQQAIDLALPDSPKMPIYKNNLGNALRARFSLIQDPSDLERAIQLHQEALDQLEKLSVDIHNLCNCLNSIGLGLAQRATLPASLPDLNRAIEMFERAVKNAPPNDPNFTLYQGSLANALTKRYGWTTNDDDLKRATQMYARTSEKGLDGATRSGFINVHNWGGLAFQRQDWREVAHSYKYARNITERLIKTQTGRGHKETWLRMTQGLFSNAAYALAKTDDLKEAVVAVETGCARLLSEALERDPRELKALQTEKPDLAKQYQESVKRVVWLEQRLEQSESGSPRLLEEFRIANRVLDSAIVAIREIPKFENFLLPPTFDQIKAAAEQQPLVYLLTTEAGGLALIIYADNVLPVQLAFTSAELIELLVKHDGAGAVSGYLIHQEEESPSKLIRSLSEILPLLYQQVMKPVADALQNLRPKPSKILVEVAGVEKQITPLTIIPTGRLSLLPLHAAYSKNSWFMDDFVVSYAPNARVLAEAQNELRNRNSPPCLVGVGNPLPHPVPLTHARFELEKIVAIFKARFPNITHYPLYEVEATKSALLEHLADGGYLHLSCHGYFDTENPLNSPLELSEREPLTLRDILYNEAAQPKRARLAVLSACQSAMTEYENLPDEAIGLPSGFLQAGIPGVIGSLWPVGERSTALLMEQFYKNHLGQDKNPAVALWKAQLWLREPNTGPYYWAAFTFYGS